MSGSGAGPSTARPDPYLEAASQILTSLGPNTHYPRNVQGRARYVTRDDPWVGQFSRDVHFVHTNQRYDHRFYRKKRKTDVVKHSDRVIPDVFQYMNGYNADDVYEVNRLALMPQSEANNALPAARRIEYKNTLEGSWIAAWNHLGRNVRFNNPAPQLPCDTLYLRHPTEEEYQRRLRNLFDEMIRYVNQHGTSDGYNTNEIRSLLPRPITVYYIFREYYDWIEDTGFEKRKRCPRGEDALSFLISWSNINMHAVPVQLRHEVYLQTPTDIRNMELSDIYRRLLHPLLRILQEIVLEVMSMYVVYLLCIKRKNRWR